MDKKAEYLRVNRAIFGHESFRSVQGEIIETAMSGQDVFVLWKLSCTYPRKEGEQDKGEGGEQQDKGEGGEQKD